jgi:hypothetical protein
MGSDGSGEILLRTRLGFNNRQLDLGRLWSKETSLADFESSWLSNGDVCHSVLLCFAFGGFLLIDLCPSVLRYISTLLRRQQCHVCARNVSKGKAKLDLNEPLYTYE